MSRVSDPDRDFRIIYVESQVQTIGGIKYNANHMKRVEQALHSPRIFTEKKKRLLNIIAEKLAAGYRSLRIKRSFCAPSPNHSLIPRKAESNGT